MSDQSTSRRILLAGGLVGSALGGLVLNAGDADAAVVIPTAPSVQFFLDLAGIPGDSTDAQFPHTFEIFDWTYGATTSVGPTRTGGARGKVQPHDLTFTKLVDKASPKLFLACATGKHISSATLVARKQGADQAYLKIVLKDVYVSGYHTAPNGGDAIPLDVVGLDYAQLEIDYTFQNAAGGPSKTVTAAFDFVKNKVL
jgi:type VI secretion system secreted protein Hcp